MDSSVSRDDRSCNEMELRGATATYTYIGTSTLLQPSLVGFCRRRRRTLSFSVSAAPCKRAFETIKKRRAEQRPQPSTTFLFHLLNEVAYCWGIWSALMPPPSIAHRIAPRWRTSLSPSPPLFDEHHSKNAKEKINVIFYFDCISHFILFRFVSLSFSYYFLFFALLVRSRAFNPPPPPLVPPSQQSFASPASSWISISRVCCCRRLKCET